MRRTPTLALSLAGVVFASGCGGNSGSSGAAGLPRQTANADGISPITSGTDVIPTTGDGGTVSGVLSSSIVIPIPAQRVTKAILHRNTADETMLTAALTDGTTLDYLCKRDPFGAPNRLVAIRRYGLSSQPDEVWYDRDGLPALISMADGTVVRIERFENGECRVNVATGTASSTTTFSTFSTGPILFLPGSNWPFGKEVWPEFYKPVPPEAIENPTLQFGPTIDPDFAHNDSAALIASRPAAIASTTAVALKLGGVSPVSTAVAVSASWYQLGGTASAIPFEPSPTDSSTWVGYIPVKLMVPDVEDQWQVLPISRLLQKACIASASRHGTMASGVSVTGFYQTLRASAVQFAEVTNGTELMGALGRALDLVELTYLLDVANSDHLRALAIASVQPAAVQTAPMLLEILISGFTGDGRGARQLVVVETGIGIPSLVSVGTSQQNGPAIGLYKGTFTLPQIPGNNFPIEVDVVSNQAIFVRTFDERMPDRAATENIVLHADGSLSFSTVPSNGVVYSFVVSPQGENGLAGTIAVQSPTIDGSQTLNGTVSLIRDVVATTGQ